MPKAYLTKITRDNLAKKILEAFTWIGWTEIVKPDSKVYVKVNLTWPLYKPGVTTSPLLIDALLEVLRSRAEKVYVCESDGGNHSYFAEDTFKGHGLYDICEKHGAELVNLSKLERYELDETVGGKRIRLPLPAPLLDDDVVFITVPVLKTHCMTGISFGLKNQWGTVPDTMRLLHHSYINEALVAINRRLNPRIVLIDALFAQDGNGPLMGEPVKKDMIIATDGVAASEPVCCAVMGTDLDSINHLRTAKREGMLADLADIETNVDPKTFHDRDFKSTRIWLDHISYALFTRRWATKLVYDSFLTKIIYFFLGLVRRDPMGPAKEALAEGNFEVLLEKHKKNEPDA
jgi:uncharacterized protein (DUF362 family)